MEQFLLVFESRKPNDIENDIEKTLWLCFITFTFTAIVAPVLAEVESNKVQ